MQPQNMELEYGQNKPMIEFEGGIVEDWRTRPSSEADWTILLFYRDDATREDGVRKFARWSRSGIAPDGDDSETEEKIIRTATLRESNRKKLNRTEDNWGGPKYSKITVETMSAEEAENRGFIQKILVIKHESIGVIN